MSRFDVDRQLGPLSVRVWALIANLIFNATALYGVSRILTSGSGHGFLVAGVVGTIVCVASLSQPVRD